MPSKATIDERSELKIRTLAREFGYEDTPLTSKGTHQIELKINTNNGFEYVYISRFTGVSKGQLQIVLSPNLDDTISNELYITDGILSAETGGKRGKDIQSSQYKGFQNKEKTGEYKGRAWRISNTENLSELEKILTIIAQSYESREVSDIVEDAGETKGPERKGVYVDRIIRDTAISKKVKEMYGYACQVCGTKIKTKDGFYSEGSHIKPLGSPHNGPDVLENILCLCPNHHVMFDYGVIAIKDDMTLLGVDGSLTIVDDHYISAEYVAYHRENEFYKSISECSLVKSSKS